MAGRGPAPKPEGQRRHRIKPAVSTTHFVDDGRVRGPSLEKISGRRGWDKRVTKWFETWRRVPQAASFISTDWQRLAMLAEIVEAFYRKPSKALFEEIRLNEERFGATVVDRQRARFVIEKADDAPVLEIVDKRKEIEKRLRGDKE